MGTQKNHIYALIVTVDIFSPDFKDGKQRFTAFNMRGITTLVRKFTSLEKITDFKIINHEDN